MFKMALVALALVATPAFAQQHDENTATLVSLPSSYTTPLAPLVQCQTGDAVARIEAAAVYAREDNPDVDASTQSRLVEAAIEEKVSQLVAAGDCAQATGHS